MFSTILKNKIEIEDRVTKLQNNYITAIQLRKFENKTAEEEEDAKSELANTMLQEKQNKLKEICTDYKTSVQSYEHLGSLIKEQKEVALQIHNIVESTLKTLNITIPADLQYNQNINNTDNFDESDKENSKGDSFFEKENENFVPKIRYTSH